MRKLILLFVAIFLLGGCASQSVVDLNPTKYQSPETYLKALNLEVSKELPEEGFVMPAPGPRLALIEVFAQDVNARVKPYIGKQIVEKKYLLKNHSLQKEWGAQSQVIANLWLDNGKVIGGNLQVKQPNSTTYVNEGYSLRGRSLKDITKLEFDAWLDKWKQENYKNATTNG